MFEPQSDVQLEMADGLKDACKYAASIFYVDPLMAVDPKLFPKNSDDSATVTFVSYKDKTYAVTCWHVIALLRKRHFPDVNAEGTFATLVNMTAYMLDRFQRVPANFPDPQPDIAIRRIDNSYPESIGKKAFVVSDSDTPPEIPIPFALAVGFPTKEKKEIGDEGGRRLALPCVWAIAEGVGGSGRRMQFYSDLKIAPEVLSLSGMSGGPVFWSKGEEFGLLGIIYEGSDTSNDGKKDTLGGGARSHFLCERATPEIFCEWAAAADAAYEEEGKAA